MTRVAREIFISNAQEVSRRSQILSSKLLSPHILSGIDYLSVFTRTQAEYEELSVVAAALGNKVYEKRGSVYRIQDKDVVLTLPSPIVRLSEPTDVQLIGCVDIIPTNFDAAREELLGAGYQEEPKSLNGHDYTIIEAMDPELGVAIYLPSLQMTRVMGID